MFFKYLIKLINFFNLKTFDFYKIWIRQKYMKKIELVLFHLGGILIINQFFVFIL